jgi:hypothetical protein
VLTPRPPKGRIALVRGGVKVYSRVRVESQDSKRVEQEELERDSIKARKRLKGEYWEQPQSS